MAMGRPRASAMAWIFVVRPPRERPIACACAPLFRPPPSGGPWPSYLTIAGIGGGPRFTQATPDPAHRPAAKAIVDCRRRPVDGRAILPATASFQNVNDAADHPPIIGPSGSRLVLRKRRLNGSPLRLAQPKFARHDPSLQPDS